MKNVIKTVGSLSLFALFAFFACSNNTNNTNASTELSTPATSVDGLVLNGISESAKVEILFADNYLKKVINGNPYDSTPSLTVNPSLTHIVKAQVKVSDLYIFSRSVNIVCDKDEPSNKIEVVLMGSNQLGHSVTFLPNSSDGLFYAEDLVTSTMAVQGPEDEIEYATILGGNTNDIVYTFFCRGSDGNDYNLFFHGNYDANNMKIRSIFDFQTSEFTGVISISLKDYNTAPVTMYFDKQ